MLAQQRDGTFYVDKDGNGAQSDMPFEYCVITIYTVNTGDGTENIRALAFAFDIVTGNVKVKRVNVVGSSRDYPWVDLYTSAMLTNSAQLSALASALGGVGINKFVFVPTVYNLTNAYAEIIANINAAYPNASNSIFMGRFTKGTEGFYILYTYGNNGQQEYPEYSVGMLMQWAGETISSFGTVSQVPYSRSVSLTTT